MYSQEYQDAADDDDENAQSCLSLPAHGGIKPDKRQRKRADTEKYNYPYIWLVIPFCMRYGAGHYGLKPLSGRWL
jgi:hypothetical protein